MPLHPDYEAMLAAMEELGGPKIIEMSVAAAREMFRMMQPPVEIPVGKVENTAIDGPGGRIPLRIYTPSAEEDGPWPIAMMFHGGGWVIGNLDTADSQSRELCTGADCIVVSVDYRLAPERRGFRCCRQRVAVFPLRLEVDVGGDAAHPAGAAGSDHNLDVANHVEDGVAGLDVPARRTDEHGAKQLHRITVRVIEVGLIAALGS